MGVCGVISFLWQVIVSTSFVNVVALGDRFLFFFRQPELVTCVVCGWSVNVFFITLSSSVLLGFIPVIIKNKSQCSAGVYRSLLLTFSFFIGVFFSCIVFLGFMVFNDISWYYALLMCPYMVIMIVVTAVRVIGISEQKMFNFNRITIKVYILIVISYCFSGTSNLSLFYILKNTIVGLIYLYLLCNKYTLRLEGSAFLGNLKRGMFLLKKGIKISTPSVISFGVEAFVICLWLFFVKNYRQDCAVEYMIFYTVMSFCGLINESFSRTAVSIVSNSKTENWVEAFIFTIKRYLVILSCAFSLGCGYVYFCNLFLDKLVVLSCVLLCISMENIASLFSGALIASGKIFVPMYSNVFCMTFIFSLFSFGFKGLPCFWFIYMPMLFYATTNCIILSVSLARHVKNAT